MWLAAKPSPFNRYGGLFARSGDTMTEAEKTARKIVEKWIWDCGGSLVLTFVQSELLQQRIIEALPPTPQESGPNSPADRNTQQEN